MRWRRQIDTEPLYRRGVERWAARDLENATVLLEAALKASPDPCSDGWWFSASRALAQIALEQDDPELAERHLTLLPGHGVGNAQQEGLRARVAIIAGDHDRAAIQASVAIGALSTDVDEDVGTLMNGAIALMWCGEVMVDLGYGHEAARLVGTARQRIAKAGITDPVLEGGLAIVEAGANRLMGDVVGATVALAAIETSLSPEFGIQVASEKARLAWAVGNLEVARSLFTEAVAECHVLHYPALARLLGAEAEGGPVEARSHPLPVEEWENSRLEELLANHRPYAVVATLPVDGSYDPYFELARQVEGLLKASPHLGVLDGTGTDGEIWDLYLDGEDPQALWEAVAPLVMAVAGAGSSVALRRGDEIETIPLS